MKQHCASLATLAVLAAVGTACLPQIANAQGCEPIRFTTPVNLGGEGQAYQRGREWQLSLAYRRLVSDEFFVGTAENSALGPGGQAPVFRIHTFVADLAYSINDRYRVRVSVPVSTGSVTRMWPDKALHTQSASGLGDVSVMGEAWLLTPRTHANGNFSVGLGLKAPTGSHTIGSRFYTATNAIDFPADQTVQPGDGGWALLLQSQAFRQITERTFGYAVGSYMVSPKTRSDVRNSPNTGLFWSVPDVYSARLGGAFSVLPDQGFSMSLGGRIDGIPVHDLLGGGDDSTIKRTSYVVYADPGLSLTRGKGTFTLSVPYRLAVNRKKSLFEQETATAVNGGGFAKYLVFAGYSYRF
jgi:hypothetical protein